MSDFKSKLNEDIKTAMRSGEKAKLTTLRLILAEIKKQEIDQRIELDSAAIYQTLNKMVKQRREAMEHFVRGKRPDLVAKEQAELDIINSYLPTPFSEAEIKSLIQDTLATVGPLTTKDLGKVMNALKPKIQGRADMKQVNAMVKQYLDTLT